MAALQVEIGEDNLVSTRKRLLAILLSKQLGHMHYSLQVVVLALVEVLVIIQNNKNKK